MAEEIPIKLNLEGFDAVLAKMNQFGSAMTASLSGLNADAQSASEMLSKMADAIERAAEAQKKYENAAANGGIADAPQTASDQTIQAPENLKFTFGGEIWKEALDTIKDSISPEDFKEIADTIVENFTKPLNDIPTHANKAGSAVKEAGEKGTQALEKAGGAAKDFIEALMHASSGSLISGMTELSGAIGMVASSFGAGGKAIAGALGEITLFAATVAGVVTALDAAAVHAANAVVDMDNLGKSAGVNAQQIFRLQEAFVEFGSNGEQLQQVIRNITTRMLSDWPEVEKAVRDSADGMASALIKVTEAYRALEEVKRQGQLMDEKIREGERAVAQASREVEAAKEAETKAALKHADALDNEARAQIRLKDAERGIESAQRRQAEAGFAVEEALKKQKLAMFAAADAAAKLKQAQLSLADTQNSYDSAKLEADKLRYQISLRNGGSRDRDFERSIPERERKIREDAIFNREADAEAALKKAKDDKRKAEIAASFPNREKEQADIDVQDALENKKKADEAVQIAQLDVAKAQRDVAEAQLAVADTQRDIAAAADALPAAVDRLTIAISNLGQIRSDALDQPNREKEAEINLRNAQYALEDYRRKDPTEILKSLNATAEERKSQDLVKLDQVSVEAMGRAIALAASPDGGDTAPNAYQIIMKMNELLSKNPNDAALNTQIGKLIASRGSSPQAILNALKQSPEEFQKVMGGVDPNAVNRYSPAMVEQSKEVKLFWEKLKSELETGALTVGQGAQPGAINDMKLAAEGTQAVTGFIRDLTEGTGKAGSAASVLAGTFNGLNKDAETLRSVFSSVSSAYSGMLNTINQYVGDGDPNKYAGGGHVRGPGTSKSDSIPAWLSDNEYVINSDAVNHYGVGMLDRINARGFALGGFVGNAPRFAAGGLAKAGEHYMLDITTDAGSFSAMVNGDTVRALGKSAMGAKLKSSGVKPSWWK